jgi:formylglycine-generating enzyme required for sulfatase activity
MKTVEFKLSQKTTLEMIEIPAGKFLMGSSTQESFFRENETPQHEVEISSFIIGKFPVTQSQWFSVMNQMPKISEDFRGENLPVVNVWLEKALEFCSELSKLTGKTFRLPTEAEWEYACRARTLTSFTFGETISRNLANYDNTHLSPVGEFPPNAFGIYDMHGNVWEWCADIWHENYIGAPNDGSAWLMHGDQSYCVQRGGSWIDRAINCRSAFRVGDIAHNSDHIVGLRVCIDKK